MASSRKSLSDFVGLSWSSWSEYRGEFSNSDDGEEEENTKNDSRRKSSDVMRLFSSDMQKFGLFPETDCFCTVVCSECNALVKPQGLLNHMRIRHKELVPGKISPEKVNKFAETSSFKNVGERTSAKHVLNEKLMSKLILNEKLSNKAANEKLASSPSEKFKSVPEKIGSKFSGSEKTSLKTTDKFVGKVVGDKLPRTASDKVKLGSEKIVVGSSLLADKTFERNESDKFIKIVSDTYPKQVDVPTLKLSKINEKQSVKAVPNEKFLPKYSSPENKIFAVGERHLSRSGEKISVKSVLSEKLLSKVAASEKGAVDKPKNLDHMKVDGCSKKGERLTVKPVMKSLLKEKVLRNDTVPNVVPGTSLLRPIILQDREPLLLAGSTIGSTALSPPILTPQNLTPERHQSATDMPVLSRKRKFRERKAAPTQYDPDRHCGVWCDYFNKFCIRSLTCKVHSVALRRAVVGRSKPFDQLLLEHKRAKEDQRQSKEDPDNVSELSPQLSDRLHSPSEPSNSSFVSSPCGSPASSRAPSPTEIVYHIEDDAVALSTPSTSTNPPVPLPSYQYPPYPPPESSFVSAPESMVVLSPHLSSPLLSVALPSLSPNHIPRPSDGVEEDCTKYPRDVARSANRLQLNKGKHFNVKHTAFPPKPLRTCLFQGRKSSGMFFVQRELESMRSGFRLSVVKGSKSLPLSHVSNTGQTLSETVASHSPVSVHSINDPILHGAGIINSPQMTAASSLKSVLTTLCSPKTVLNRDSQPRIQRVQKPASNGSEMSPQSLAADGSLSLNTEKLSQSMRISVPTTMPQQIAYLTTSTPVTFQQVPIINSQVLGQLQLQSKSTGGTLKLLSTGGGGRTLLVHQYQDGSGAES